MESRKRKRFLFAFAGVVAVGAGLWLALNRNTEPSYQGRKLSAWIAVYGYAGVMKEAPTVAERNEAGRAIQAIGTNALPYLLEWITYEPGTLRYQILTYEEKVPNWLKDRSVFYQRVFGGLERASCSQAAFEVLGDQAIPAIPELHRLACTAGQRETQVRAVHCLFNIGPAASADLTSVLATTGIADKQWVMTRLRGLGTNATPFFPILIKQLKHGRLESAVRSAEMLGTLKLNPEEVIPALIARLADPHPEMRTAAAISLARFGEQAIIALPALNQLVTEPEQEVSAVASEAIKFINSVAPP